MAKRKDNEPTPKTHAPYSGMVSFDQPVKAALDALDKTNAQDPETLRAGKRELWVIVRHVGRGDDDQREKVAAELLKSLALPRPAQIRRELIWMLSEISGDELVAPVASMLGDPEMREDARLVLQRMPGDASLAALKQALASAPPEFKPSLAVSLRARGVEVPGVPDEKLKPTRETTLKPVGRA